MNEGMKLNEMNGRQLAPQPMNEHKGVSRAYQMTHSESERERPMAAFSSLIDFYEL